MSEAGRHRFERRIRALKEALPIERYAAEVTELKSFGETLRGPCPVHRGDNPTSFAVRPEAGRARCFSCDFGGDVLDLFMAVEGYKEGEKAFATVALAERYGVELPTRPASWHRNQSEKFRVQDLLQNTLAASYRRRFFQVIRPMLDGAGEEEAREVWRALWLIARERAERRMVERGLL